MGRVQPCRRRWGWRWGSRTGRRWRWGRRIGRPWGRDRAWGRASGRWIGWAWAWRMGQGQPWDRRGRAWPWGRRTPRCSREELLEQKKSLELSRNQNKNFENIFNVLHQFDDWTLKYYPSWYFGKTSILYFVLFCINMHTQFEDCLWFHNADKYLRLYFCHCY